ncbi:DNRLRE domain-containing protein [Amycolatopsis sp. FDAARGOS 1241]|uniref:DNRLRE domain-containing protein n=1 Tax=Amycolatopsis sp. FDAARGOS 1241 TaxID=2778070 RepID=UPI00194E3877|nr:DNRLRE domain-containing protein [Amycolatopsis sp. FDAARGOS 1241]QRP49086.1 DNRLRE domain-containing protein [Amycolatopsis sp. FDAARGOS 1241]
MAASGRWARRDSRGWPIAGRGLAGRVMAVVVAIALIVSTGGQTASGSPLSSPATPQQRSGSAAGAGHTAGSALGPTTKGASAVTPAGSAPEARTRAAAADPRLSNTATSGTAQSAAPRERSAPAASTGTEITAARTATRSVFQNADGTQTAKVYPRPVHYRTSSGAWGDIDTNLAQGGNGRWAEKADSASASFAAAADDATLASVPAGPGGSIAFGVQGAAHVTGHVTDSTITYPGAAAHTDISYLATASGGVKENLTLASADAPTTWVFPLTLTGVTPSMGSDGSVVFTNGAGQVVDTIAHGFMRDSNIDPRSGDGVLSTAVTYSLTTAQGKPALRMDLDATWLHDTARVFPVQVDPSVNLNTSGSTYVMSPFTNDYSGGTELDTGTYDGGANVANSYLKFDVSSLNNNYIEAATLNMDEIWSYSCQPRPMYVSPITSGWSVGGAKTYPWVSIGGAIGSSNVAYGHDSSCSTSHWVSVNLGNNPTAAGTQLIESWTHGGANNGLAVTADTHDSYGWKKFASFNTPNPPYLSITYSPNGAVYSSPVNYTKPTGTSSGSQQVTVTNLGNSTWTTTNNHLWYQLYDLNWNNLRITNPPDPWTNLPGSVGPNQKFTVNATIGPVTPGQYYLCWDMFTGNTSFNISYGVNSPCEVINSANTPPQIDSASPPSNTALSTLQPQLFATGHDPDNYPAKGITFDFQVYSLPAGGGTPALVADSGALSNGNYRVPAGKLAWNQSYYWTVAVNDTVGSSNWSSPAYFTTAVPQPLITAHIGANTSRRNFDPGVGDYTTTVTDASVATAGPALAIARSYNSQDPRVSNLFGAGWSTVYDMVAVPDSDGSGNVVVTYPDGHTVRFGLNADGTTYSPPQGTYATFSPLPGGGYSLTVRGGSTYTFGQQAGSSWKLTSITDAAGRAQTLSYDAGGHLATVTDTGGNRSLHLTWSGGHVATVSTDPATAGGQALTWSYTYSGDTLTAVCPPTSSSQCTGYSYTSGSTPGSHYRSTVLDAQPYAYWRLNQSAGATAVDEVSANLGADNGAFTTVSPSDSTPHPGSPSTSSYFNGAGSLQLPNNLVSSASYLSVQLWFQTFPNGSAGVLMSTGHSAIDTANPNPGAMPVLYIGTDGKLYGQFWTGSVAPIVSSGKVNDSAWHSVTLVGQGNTQSMYLDGALVGSQAGTLINLDPMNFVAAGYVNGYPWVNGPAAGWSHFNGNIADVAFYTRALGGPAIAQQVSAGKQPAAELTSITTPEGKTHAQVTYDNVLDRATHVTDQYGGAWTLAPPTSNGSSAQYRGTVFAGDPTDFWPLTDTTGTQAVNQIPTSAISATADGDGTYANVTLGQPGPMPTTGDTAVSFNGTTSSLTIPVQSTAWTVGGKTLALWFKTSTAGGVLTGWGGNALLYIGTDGKLYTWYGSGYLNSPGTVTDGKWHYVVVSQTADFPHNSISQTEYLDGATAATATAPIINAPGLQTATIGSGLWGSGAPANNATANPGGYFTGSVADVAFYNTPLTAGPVAGLWTAAQAANTSPTPVTTATVTDPGNHPLSYRYDPVNGSRLLSTADALGNTTHYTYDTNGFGYTTVYPDGNTVTTTHDLRGNVLSRTIGASSGGAATSYATFPAAGTYAVTDPRNDEPLTTLTADSSGPSDTTYQTSYTYDAAGGLLTLTNPAGSVTTNTYTTGSETAVGGGTEPAGLLATQKDPLGHITNYSYTAAGDAAGITAPSGMATTATFDLLGRKLTSTQTSDTFPAGVTTSYAWDGQNRLTTQTDPATTDAVTGTTHTPQTTYIYDADGNVLAQTVSDTTGGDTARATTNTYDSHDLLATTTDPANRQTSYGYDSYGNRTSTTDPAGNIYADSFDANGHHTATTLTNWTGDPNHPIAATNLVLDSRAYDPDGLLASDTDAMGRTTRYTYDDSGRQLSAVVTNWHDRFGTQTPVSVATALYDAAGHPTSQFDLSSAPSASTKVYDPAGRVTSSTDADGHVTTFTYDANDQVATKTVANGSVNEETDYGYDTLGDLTSQAVHNGATTLTTTATYDQRGALTSVTDPRGNVTGADPTAYTTTYTNDPAGQLTTLTGPIVTTETDGGAPAPAHPINQYGYNTFGDQTTSSDPDGNITTSTYDADSELLGVSRPAYTPPGSATSITPLTQYTYYPLGQPASTTDPLGRTTSYTLDQLGNRVTTTQPAVDGTTPVSYATYDTDGEQLSATDPTGAQTQATYDELGQTITSTQVVRQPTSAANTTTLSYDPTQTLGPEPLDRPFSVTLPGGQTTQYGYDKLGQTTSVTDANSHTTSSAYDADGHLTQTTLPDGSAVVATFDPAGRTTATTQLDNTGATVRTLGTGYDAAGNKISATDANNHTTTYTVDAGNHITQQVQPISATASITTGYGYDAAGQTTRYTDGNNNATIYTYNSLGLPESTIAPAVPGFTTPADTTTTRTYDADSHLTTLAEPGGVTQTLGYDELGRLTSQSGTGAEATTTARTIGYDLAGRLTSASAPTGTDTFTYDDRGLTFSAAGPSGTASYTYDNNGQLTSRTDSTGTAGFTYTPTGQLATATDPLTGATASYTYNTLDQPTGIGYGTGNATQTNTYDTTHRLAAQTITAPGGATEAAITYGYDPNNNLTGKTTTGTAGAAANTYTYDQADRLTSWTDGTTTTNYAYDNAGNRTQAGPWTYTYNARDQLTTATNGTTTNTTTYDARGAQTATTDGTTTQTYTYDAFDQMAAYNGATTYTHDALGRLTTAGTTTFTYDGTDTTPTGDGTQTFSRDPGGNLLGVATGGTAATAFTDLHGDVTGLFTPTGTALTGSSAYGPYGNPVATTGTQADLGYQGGWTDPATQLVGTASRWYDPAQGDFTSHDTISTITGTAANPYTYANDNPLTYNDPNGHWGECLLIGCELPTLAGAGGTDLATTGAGVAAGGGAASWGWLGAILGGLDFLLAGDEAPGQRDQHYPSRPPAPSNWPGGYPSYGGYDYGGAALSLGGSFDWPETTGPSGHNPPGHAPRGHKPAGHGGGQGLTRPKPPTHDQIIAARVYQTPDNPRPSGQVTGPGIIPQNGTKTPATGASDSPIITNLVAGTNPSEDPTTFDPYAQPGSPDTWPGGLAPAQGSLDDAACAGGQWLFDGETWNKSSLVCEGDGGAGEASAASAADVEHAVEGGASLSLRYKPGWNAAQRSAADAKVAALNEAAGAGGLRVTPVKRVGTSPASRYRRAGGIVPSGADVDHTIDLQLGGLDDVANMNPLDLSVNRSLGSQIMWQLRGLKPGTFVISVMIW